MSHDDVAPKAGPHIDQVNAAATRVPIDSSPGGLPKLAVLGCVGVAAKSVPWELVRRSSSAIAIASRPLHPHFSLPSFLVPLALILTLSKERETEERSIQ